VVFNTSLPDLTSKLVQEVMLKDKTFVDINANNVSKQKKDFIFKLSTLSLEINKIVTSIFLSNVRVGSLF
jgi:hypothetical protein